MTLAVQYRKVSDLTPYIRNARKHPKEQVEQIAASIKEFGWTAPILVDGDNGIIAGHGRLAAAKHLKMQEVPVIELSGLTPAQKRTYLIADNQLAIEAGWDFDVLRIEVKDLELTGFDLNLLGFADVDAVMGREPEPQVQERKGQGATSLQYNLIFEDEDQRKTWFTFMRRLKGEYPEIETLGERLLAFLTEGGHIAAR